MNLNKTLLSIFKKIERHGMCKIMYKTGADELFNKRGRPEHLNGLTRYVLQVANVGNGYVNYITNQLERLKKEGEEVGEFNPEECRYSESYSENGLVRKAKTKDQFYLRFYVDMGPNKSYEEHFVTESGEEYTLTEEDKKFLKKKSKSSPKQEKAGVKKLCNPRNLKFENIVYFQFGEPLFNEISETILNLFNLEEV